jgi:hypothetical protein
MRFVPTRLTALPVAAVLGAGLLAGCGSDSSGGSSSAPAEPAPTAKTADFPKAAGKTLDDLRKNYPEGPVLAASVDVVNKGKNRFGFILFDKARKQLGGAPVALYTSALDGSDLRGPYVARAESLAVKPQFESRTTASDPDAARSLYVTDIPFAKNGKRAIIGIAKLDGRMYSTSAFGMNVGAYKGSQPPKVGEKVPKINTPTVASVGGDIASIETRDPPAPDLHQVNFADVVGKKPVVLMFATPRLCQSRVCGPVVDVAEQVKSQVGDRVAFIHEEVFNDNDVSKGYRPQFQKYRLPSEPWTFVIGSDGRVKSRFEGAVSAGELQRAVANVQ